MGEGIVGPGESEDHDGTLSISLIAAIVYIVWGVIFLVLVAFLLITALSGHNPSQR